MTPKSLFIIVLRIMGLMLLTQGLFAVPVLLSSMVQIYESIEILLSQSFSFLVFISFTFSAILTVFIWFYLFRYLIYKPDVLIDKLKLDENFDEEKFELNVHSSTVIRIAIIIIGGTMFVNRFIPFLRNLHAYFFSDENGGILGLVRGTPGISKLDIIEEAAMLVLAYFFISNSGRLTVWIERLRRK